MRINKYKELVTDNEIQFLRKDIEEKFTGYPEIKKTTAKYILIFNEITQEDTILTIYNFISTNNLKIKIQPHNDKVYIKTTNKFMDKTQGIKVTFY